MRGIVDRFEEGYAIIEIEEEMVDVPLDHVDTDVQAGDVVELRDGKWFVDTDATEERTEEIRKLMESVWEEE